SAAAPCSAASPRRDLDFTPGWPFFRAALPTAPPIPPAAAPASPIRSVYGNTSVKNLVPASLPPKMLPMSPNTEAQANMKSSKTTADKTNPTIAPRTGFPKAPAIAPTSNPMAAEGSAKMTAPGPSQHNTTRALPAAPTSAPTPAPAPDTCIDELQEAERNSSPAGAADETLN